MGDADRPGGLAVLGWDAAWAGAFEPHAAVGRAARVVGVDRGAVDLLPAEGPTRATLGGDLLAAMAEDPSSGPCAGDWGVVRSWPDGRDTVEVLLPRRTAFVRGAASGESRPQVLAANADDVLVTVSLALDPDLGRLERLLALAWESGATPSVVLTKSDLASDAEWVAADVAAAAPGAGVLVVSALTGDGMDALAALAAPGRTLALLGQSGAGKSTLVNALAGRDVQRVDDVGAVGKGRHTTVRRELVPLPGGAMLLDTPGLRGVAVVALEEGLELAFPEIDELAASCRFADCAHDGEPGCAVADAVAGGELAERRLESWRKLRREAAWMARRSDARLMAAERRKWVAISKSVRRSGVVRP